MQCALLFRRQLLLIAALTLAQVVLGELLTSTAPNPLPIGGEPVNMHADKVSAIKEVETQAMVNVSDTGEASSFVMLSSSGVVYAKGTGSIYWMAGMTSADYPWNCKCDTSSLSEWTAKEDRTYGGTSEVLCADQTSQSLFGSNKAYCDAMNGASNILNVVAGLQVLVLAVLSATIVIIL